MMAAMTTLLAIICGALAWDSFGFEFQAGSGFAQVDMNFLSWKIPVYRATEGLVLMGIWAYAAFMGLIITLVRMFVGTIVQVGYARFNLELLDGEAKDTSALFRYFHWWKNLFVAGFLQGLYILLWTLLLIIPGIVAGYRYAMTSFILAENPDMPASEAIDRSKELMNGRKFELFWLDVTFIGWVILSAFAMGIGDLWLNPYRYTSHAAFYRDITAPKAAELPPFTAEEA